MPDVPFSLIIPAAWPYVISSRFNDPRSYPYAPNRLQLHEGIDFAPTKAATSTLIVRASQRGIVDQVGYDGRGYGNFVRVVHEWGGERFATWYGHLEEARIKENSYVNAGDTLGVAGKTGNATGVHVHLTLQHIGKGLKNYVVTDVVDPEPFLRSSVVLFDEAWWVGDVTIPDDAPIEAGTPFRKTWALRNAGATTWGKGYTLAFLSDNPMNGPASVPLPITQPGEIAQVSVDLVAPGKPGRERSTWKPRRPDKQPFDFPIYTEILVTSPQNAGANEARFIADVTIPFDTPMKPGQPFVKRWRIQNSGQVEWGDGYQFAFVSDDPMGGPDFVALPHALPGDVVDVSVDLVAPIKPGKVLSTWRARDAQGHFFDFALRVEIVVIPSGQIESGALVADVVVLKPGATFVKTWRIRNLGQTRWGEDYALAFVGGDRMGAAESIPVPSTPPQAQADLSVTLTAPKLTGVYTSRWQLHNPDGTAFGAVVEAWIEVKS